MREEVLNFYLKEDENKLSYSEVDILNEIQKQRHEYIRKHNKTPIYIRLQDRSMYDFLVARYTESVIFHNKPTLPATIFGMKIK